MPQIGQFTRTPSGYAGQLRTLSLDLELTFVPTDAVDTEKAPAYRRRLGSSKEVVQAKRGPWAVR